MKSFLSFETSMLALILIVAIVAMGFEKSGARRNPAGADQTAQLQSQRLASER